MRLLFLALTFPVPANNGYRLRTWALLRGLAAEGHDISLLTFGDPLEVQSAESTAVARICSEAELVPQRCGPLSATSDLGGRLRHLHGPRPYAVERFTCGSMRKYIESHLATGTYDAVVSDIFTAVNLPTHTPPLIINFHNAEHVILRRYIERERNPLKRLYAWIEYRKMRGWEQEVCRRSRAGMACSAVDRDILARLCPSLSAFVVPNIVEVPTAYYGEADPVTVLFQGGMDWYPNRDAVEFFASRILPELRALVPAVRFIVAGRSPSPAFQRRFEGVPGMEFTGTLRDMRPVVAAAAVSVVPLRIGSGTRLKILEAAAMARPIVSTTIGAEGLDFADGRDILLVDDPRAFARTVARVLHDAELRKELGTRARRIVETRYALANLQAGVQATFKDTLRRADSSPPACAQHAAPITP